MASSKSASSIKAIAIVCIVIAILSPIAVYTYFSNVVESFKAQIESYSIQPQENEELAGKIREYMKPYDPYLNEPYLITRLGWYLHNSSDPVEESINEFTIYGHITNIGAKTAYHCKLIVKFYNGGNLLQTSEVYIGIISYWSERNFYDEVVGCQYADSVTRIEVERTWANMP